MACDRSLALQASLRALCLLPMHFFRITQLHPALRTLQENCTPRNEAPLTHQGLTATTHLDLSHLTLLQCARLTPARAPILRRSSLQTLALLASPLLLHTHLLHTNCRSALLPRARPHTPPSIPCNALVTQPFANKIPYLPQNALLALVVNTYRVRTEKSRLRLSSPLDSTVSSSLTSRPPCPCLAATRCTPSRHRGPR